MMPRIATVLSMGLPWRQINSYIIFLNSYIESLGEIFDDIIHACCIHGKIPKKLFGRWEDLQ